MLNVVCLMGRLAADPELRHTQSQIPVTSFRIAVDRTFQSKGQEKQTDWIDIVAWRNTAEFVTRYFRKGSMIAVQGSIQTRSYTDKDGNKRKAVEIVADNVHFAEPKRDSYGGGASYGTPPPPAPGGYQQRPASAMEQAAPAYVSGDTGDFEEVPTDDDLPF